MLDISNIKENDLKNALSGLIFAKILLISSEDN